MKIIIIIKINPFFENSASANRWRTLIEGLAGLGVVFELLITGGYTNIKEFSESARIGSYKGINFYYLAFLFHHNIWLRRANTYLLNLMMKPWITYRVVKIVNRNQDAVVWTSSDLDSFSLATKLKKTFPHIKTFLELSEFLDIHKLNKGNALQRQAADKRQSFFEQVGFYSYDGLALMTKTLYRHYQNFPKHGPKMLHLPMTVDLKRFSKEVKSIEGFKKPYIAFVGVMDDNKEGVSILINAFSKITKEFPSHKLYLIGGWNYDTPIHKKLISDHGLDNIVFWKGEYNRDQIPAIIKNAALLVLPRPDSHQAQGGFPTKLGEYLATGNPVCATTVGEIPDYLIDNESAFMAEPGSVDSFADAMLRALNNKEKAVEVGKNGRKVAEQYFNMDVQSKILYDFLVHNISPE
jgi:glycosyltransferase involved in cell wall biosynthesis